jgi:hypothetical protein
VWYNRQMENTSLARQDFSNVIARIRTACEHIDTVYPQMIAAAAPDRELVRRLEAAQKADRELLEYVESKIERGPSILAKIATLLLGR